MAEIVYPHATLFPDFKGIEPKEIEKNTFAYKVFVIEDFNKKVKENDFLMIYFRHRTGHKLFDSKLRIEGSLVEVGDNYFILDKPTIVYFNGEEHFVPIKKDKKIKIYFANKERYICRIFYKRESKEVSI